MPYISQKDRGRLMLANDPRTEGELNYLLTCEYMQIIAEIGESYTNYGKLRYAIQTLVTDMQLLRMVKPEFKYKVNYTPMENRLREICKNYHLTNRNDKRPSIIVSDTVGALINSSSELYRRKIAPYEDLKIKENGDVFE